MKIKLHFHDYKNHSGEDSISDAAYISEPPIEIGEVLSASTTVTKHLKFLSTGEKIKQSIAAFLIWIMSILVVSYLIFEYSSGFIFLLGVLILFGYLYFYATISFPYQCEYVGDLGIAEFNLNQRQLNIIKSKIFKFKNAESVFVRYVKNFQNGIYQNTDYSFNWKDNSGKMVYSIDGIYMQKNGLPKSSHDSYYFGQAAENAWNNYKLKEIIENLNNGRKAIFKVRQYIIQISLTEMEIIKGENNVKWDLNEIDKLEINDGKIYIYSNKFKQHNILFDILGIGVIKLPYNEMPNAQIFLSLYKYLNNNVQILNSRTD